MSIISIHNVVKFILLLNLLSPNINSLPIAVPSPEGSQLEPIATSTRNDLGLAEKCTAKLILSHGGGDNYQLEIERSHRLAFKRFHEQTIYYEHDWAQKIILEGRTRRRDTLTNRIFDETTGSGPGSGMDQMICDQLAFKLKPNQEYILRKPPPKVVDCYAALRCGQDQGHGEGVSTLEEMRCPLRGKIFFLRPFFIQCS